MCNTTTNTNTNTNANQASNSATNFSTLTNQASAQNTASNYGQNTSSQSGPVQAALDLIAKNTGPISSSQISNYQSPYTQQVIDATVAQLGQQNAQQQQELKGNAISAGAMGGDRAQLAQAALMGEQGRNMSSTIASLGDTAYQRALSAAQADRSAALTAAGMMGTQQTSSTAGASTGSTAGTTQSQTAGSQASAMSGTSSGSSNQASSTNPSMLSYVPLLGMLANGGEVRHHLADGGIPGAPAGFGSMPSMIVQPYQPPASPQPAQQPNVSELMKLGTQARAGLGHLFSAVSGNTPSGNGLVSRGMSGLSSMGFASGGSTVSAPHVPAPAVASMPSLSPAMAYMPTVSLPAMQMPTVSMPTVSAPTVQNAHAPQASSGKEHGGAVRRFADGGDTGGIDFSQIDPALRNDMFVPPIPRPAQSPVYAEIGPYNPPVQGDVTAGGIYPMREPTATGYAGGARQPGPTTYTPNADFSGAFNPDTIRNAYSPGLSRTSYDLAAMYHPGGLDRIARGMLEMYAKDTTPVSSNGVSFMAAPEGIPSPAAAPAMANDARDYYAKVPNGALTGPAADFTVPAMTGIGSPQTWDATPVDANSAPIPVPATIYRNDPAQLAAAGVPVPGTAGAAPVGPDTVVAPAGSGMAAEATEPKPHEVTPGGMTAQGENWLKGKEGYSERPYGDFKQTSIGYGTRARDGETSITPEAATARMREETGKVNQWIDKNIPNMPAGPRRDALISFGYNLGTGKLDTILPTIRSGDWDAVGDRMEQYNRAGGAVNPGLVTRRAEEAAMVRTGTNDAPVAAPDAGVQHNRAQGPAAPAGGIEGIGTGIRDLFSKGTDQNAPQHPYTSPQDQQRGGLISRLVNSLVPGANFNFNPLNLTDRERTGLMMMTAGMSQPGGNLGTGIGAMANYNTQAGQVDRAAQLDAMKLRMEAAKLSQPIQIGEYQDAFGQTHKQYGVYNAQTGQYTAVQPGAAMPGAPGAGQPPAGAVDLKIGGNTHGEEYLSSLDQTNPMVASATAQARDVLAGRESLPNISKANAAMGAAVQRIVRQADPTYNANRYNYQKAWSDPNSKIGTTRIANNTAIQHMGELSELVQRMPDAHMSGASHAANVVTNWWRSQTNDPVLADWKANAEILAGEVAKVNVGGQSAVSDRREIMESLNPANGRAALNATLEKYTKLLDGKTVSLERDYVKNMGPHAERPNAVDPENQQILDRLKQRYMAGHAPANTAQASGQAAANTAPTATGPNGARVTLMNGKWVPVQ
jgi:GH24 family phage-related lysozyme (muramidase)